MKRLVKLLRMVHRGLGGHADARMSMNTYNIRYSEMSELTEQEVLRLTDGRSPPGRQRLVAQRHQQRFSGGEVAGTPQ